MLAAHLDSPAAPVIDAMRARGVLVCAAGPQGVRFLPPFVSTEGDIDELIAAFAGALSDVGH